MYESYLEHTNINGENNTTIERIDVNKDYCFNNCKWATWDEHAKNNRSLEVKSPYGVVYSKSLAKFL